jgi:hypothetical protein
MSVAREVIGLVLSTSAQFGQVTAMTMMDTNTPVPDNVRPSIVLTGPMGRPRIVIDKLAAAYSAVSVPAGLMYDVSIEDLPAGYAVKSITGEAVPGMAGTANIKPVVIVLEQK